MYLALSSGAFYRRNYKKGDEVIFEPMLDYKYSNIALGATPIGSAERAPDRGWDNQCQR
jgi:hypothetical protein